MKNLVRTVMLLGLVAAAAGVAAFHLSANPPVQTALRQQDAMAWLRADFDLNDEQFAAIQRLHEAYAVECERHCLDIQEAALDLAALRASGTADAATLAAAQRRVADLSLLCETAIAAHVRQCAAHMSPAAGARYLALVLPKIKDFDHRGAPDLGLGHGSH